MRQSNQKHISRSKTLPHQKSQIELSTGCQISRLEKTRPVSGENFNIIFIGETLASENSTEQQATAKTMMPLHKQCCFFIREKIFQVASGVLPLLKVFQKRSIRTFFVIQLLSISMYQKKSRRFNFGIDQDLIVAHYIKSTSTSIKKQEC